MKEKVIVKSFMAAITTVVIASCSITYGQSWKKSVPDAVDRSAIRRCIAGSSKPEMKIKAMGPLSAHSRIGDFDGDGKKDFAVLVSAVSDPRLHGLLVCRNGDARLVGTFGALFASSLLLSSFDDDNFITRNWDVIPKDNSTKIALDEKGKSIIEEKNRGDVITFFHEGGSVFIFWDGSRFRLVEGG